MRKLKIHRFSLRIRVEANMFTTWFIACVASVSARVSRESRNESKTGKLRGRGKGRRETFPSSILPIHLLPFFFGSRCNFRAITWSLTPAMHFTILINHGFPDVISSPFRCRLSWVRGKQPVFTATGSGNLPGLLHGKGVPFQIKGSI